MLGFFPRIFHILVAQLRRCFCSASSCEEHIISKISLEHKYEKNLRIFCIFFKYVDYKVGLVPKHFGWNSSMGKLDMIYINHKNGFSLLT